MCHISSQHPALFHRKLFFSQGERARRHQCSSFSPPIPFMSGLESAKHILSTQKVQDPRENTVVRSYGRSSDGSGVCRSLHCFVGGSSGQAEISSLEKRPYSCISGIPSNVKCTKHRYIIVR